MRKTDLTPEVRDKICQILRAGNTRRAAYEAVGISHTTFHNWLNRGQSPKTGKNGKPIKSEVPFVEFLEAVTRAEAECEVYHVANLKQQAAQDWRASIEWLKRRRPQDWSEQRRLDVTSDGEKIMSVDDWKAEAQKRVDAAVAILNEDEMGSDE